MCLRHLLCHIKRKGADSANALAKARPKPEEVNEEESDLLQEVMASKFQWQMLIML